MGGGESMKPTIEISRTEDGQIQTYFRPFNGSTIHIGMMLASAARVIAASFRDQAKLTDQDEAAILAQIVRVFNDDIAMGSMGETATLEDLTQKETHR